MGLNPIEVPKFFSGLFAIGLLHLEVMTNASFKQWLGILLMTKIDRAHKSYVTPEIWEEMHLREIFYGTLIFQQSIMIFAAMLEGILLPSDMEAKTAVCLYLVKGLIVTLRCAVNVTTSSFQ